MKLTVVLLLKAQPGEDCLHAEKVSLPCASLGLTHAVGELSEPTLMNCGGGVQLSEMFSD